MNLIDTITCQRCTDDAAPYCDHGRGLCAECAWSCPECQIEWAESENYDADRDEL